MTITIDVPLADPEAAALDLIVQAAETASGSTAFRAVLQDLAGALEGAFVGLVWDDARLAAAAIAYDACTEGDAVGSLRIRSASMRAGYWDRHCANPEGIAQALDVAATVLDVM
ncbi:MAG TPA: amino acid aminotransferase [Mycobacterium sp.]|jgi:hypothetical protein|nr:amino acid aminotransferase [Mycobacterium sp.]